jgi:hypothetical protein
MCIWRWGCGAYCMGLYLLPLQSAGMEVVFSFSAIAITACHCVLRWPIVQMHMPYAVNQTMDGSLSVGTGFTI